MTTALGLQSYTIFDAAKTVSVPAFSPAKSVCGTFTYSATYADSTPLDSSVFTFTSAAAPSLQIQSSDYTKAGSYSIKVSGY